MYKQAKPFFIICESPLHAGSGSDLGIVDLPIQRERHTDFPKIEASGLKGSIREAFENKKKYDLGFRKDIHRVFGFDSSKDLKDNDQETEIKEAFPAKQREFSSAIGFTDARILLFPVKSMKGVFAWITCPDVISRYKKDLEICGQVLENIPKKETVPQNSSLIIKDNKIVLEEYTFTVKQDETCTKFAESLANSLFSQGGDYQYWAEKLKQNLVVLSNDDFKDFVNLSTEVITRTKIDNQTGTVAPGALFTEEYLPSESVMYSIVMTSPLFCKNEESAFFKDENSDKKVMSFFTENIPPVIQIGGNFTHGKGLVRISIKGE